MGTVNLTRESDAHKKKSKCISAVKLDYSKLPALDNYELFIIPEDAIITDAYIDVLEVAQATVTGDFGFAGGTELISNADLNAAVAVVKDAGIKISTGTGKTVTFKPDVIPTQGIFVFVVEYIEYALKSGNLTSFSATT